MTPVDVEVSIVGAGAAGLAAAASLQARGLDCLIVEARDRIGGRAWTDTTTLNGPFDLGASFIHAAEQGNPWADIALAMAAPVIIDPRRRWMLAAGASAACPVPAAFDATATRAGRDLAAAMAGGNERSIGALLPRVTSMDHFAAARIGPWLSGEDTDLLDPADFLAARDGEDWLLPHGYGTLVVRFGAQLPVRLGCAVEAIRTTPERVELVTAQGIVRSRYTILTAPLGVLAARRLRLDPPPSPEVEAAWAGLPMGMLMKVGLGFDRDVFGLGRDLYLFAEPTSERSILYLVRPGGHNHVMAFVGGSLARDLGALPTPALREAVAAPLIAHLGSAISGHIGACLRSDWQRDPWALGSYAVARPGRGDSRAVLRTPLSERLVYAGEAAAGDGWHGTVAGAYLSGRAAARIVAQAVERHGVLTAW